MTSLKIAAAQCASVAGNVVANVKTHCRFIQQAAAAHIDVLVFPELSLSGYELPLLGGCALSPNDEALAPLRELSHTLAITAIIGAPIRLETERPGIGAIAFRPDGSTSVYLKQYLHPGEERYVAAGAKVSATFPIRGEKYSLAICADTGHDAHAAAASTAGATLYLAGVLISEGGYAADSAQIQSYAARYGMGTLLANHGGPSGGYVSAGRSAFWLPDGKLLVAAPGAGNYLVTATKTNNTWTGELMVA